MIELTSKLPSFMGIELIKTSEGKKYLHEVSWGIQKIPKYAKNDFRLCFLDFIFPLTSNIYVKVILNNSAPLPLINSDVTYGLLIVYIFYYFTVRAFMWQFPLQKIFMNKWWFCLFSASYPYSLEFTYSWKIETFRGSR